MADQPVLQNRPIRANETAFRNMLHGVQQNGQALQHTKYRYLGYLSCLFMPRLVATVVMFIAAYLPALE